ncbi:MAG TPA: oligosaccharide flippase family protein, partial [Dehalococcoidia bacterium]|nr:oligosaccharide flippase family protein [Dehalococcoidia bacterium]
NNLCWLLVIGGVWVAAAIGLGLKWSSLMPGGLGPQHFLVFALGGASLLLLAFVKDLLIGTGSLLGYNLLEFAEPFLRALLIVIAVFALGVGIVGVLFAWLLAIVLAGLLALRLLARRTSLRPSFGAPLFREQLSFGLRGYLGFVFQAVNYRLDVFLVASFAGSTALGYYAVAFGMAEMLWHIPFALGAVFFPKAAALDLEANAEAAAITCRRAVFITALVSLGLLACARFLITFLYGNEFSAAVTAFYILLPSASLYTVHKVLSSSLAARGMPEASLYGGILSFPVTIGLGFLLIPRLGIEGAAIASVCAYTVNATVILVLFLRVTGRSIADILLIGRGDIESSLAAARALFARNEAVATE